jgi:hypothetical protein
MATLTPKQVNELGKSLLAMAESIGEYRRQHFDSLSIVEKKEIKDLQLAILKYADQLFTLSAVLVLDEVQIPLSSIEDLTNQMKITLQTLRDVQKAIDIATSVVNLGGAIFSSDPKAMAVALSNLSDQLNKD